MEQPLLKKILRYTLTYSEGKLSVYAGSSHRKYLVVQFA